MKKKVFLPISFGILAMTISGLLAGGKVAAVSGGTYTNPDYETPLTKGEISADSYIHSCWGYNTAAKRLDENKVVILDESNWGRRSGVENRKFDIATFHIVVDVEGLSNNNAMVFIFGNNYGSYPTEADKLLTFDIVKATDNNTNYISTVSTTVHNTSIPSYTDGGKWADDANYTGVQFTSDNNKVDFRINKDNASTSTITVNGISTVVQNSELFEKCLDGTQGYFCLGFVNPVFGDQMCVIDLLEDGTDKEYKSSMGAFGKTKAELARLAAVAYDSLSVAETLAIKKDFDAIPYKDLYAYDKEFFKTSYNEVKAKVDEAVAKAGSSINLTLLKEAIEEMETIKDSLTTTELIDRMLQLKTTATNLVLELDSATLSQAELEQFRGLKERLEAAVGKIIPAMKAVYEKLLAAFEEAVTKVIPNAEEFLKVTKLRDAVPIRFNEFLESKVVEDFSNRLNAATAKLNDLTTINHENWIQGAKSSIIKRADESIDIVSAGSYAGVAPESGTGLFSKELISVRDFEMVFSIDRFPDSIGSWFTIAVLEHSSPFIVKEDISVQDNKGIFFLITKINSQELGVQAFIMTMTCNRFYDAPLVQTIKIPMATELKLTFKEVSKTVAGVSGTYFEMKFNDIGFDQENIAVNTIKTALTTREGYLSVGTSGFAGNNPGIMHIQSINGYSPLGKTIRKEIQVAPPTSTDTEATFIMNSTASVVYKLDTKNESLTSVAVDGAKLTSSNYSFANNKLTLKNAYLTTLTEGDHTVVASTAGGSVTWTLHVKKEGTDPEPPKPSGGCGGSIIAAGAILSTLTLAGCALVYSKKRKEDK